MSKSEKKNTASRRQKQGKSFSSKESKARAEDQPRTCFNEKCHLDSGKLAEFASGWELTSTSMRLLRYAHFILKNSSGDLNRWHFHSIQTIAELVELRKDNFSQRCEVDLISQGYVTKMRFSDKRGDKTSWRRLGPAWDRFRGKCEFLDVVLKYYEDQNLASNNYSDLDTIPRTQLESWGRTHFESWGRTQVESSNPMYFKPIEFKEEKEEENDALSSSSSKSQKDLEERTFESPFYDANPQQNGELDMRDLRADFAAMRTRVDEGRPKVLVNERRPQPQEPIFPTQVPQPKTKIPLSMTQTKVLGDKVARAKVWSLIGPRSATEVFPAEIKGRIFDVIDEKNAKGLIPAMLARVEKFLKDHEYPTATLVQEGEMLSQRGLSGLVKLLAQEENAFQGSQNEAT